jgi:hypothetical protein
MTLDTWTDTLTAIPWRADNGERRASFENLGRAVDWIEATAVNVLTGEAFRIVKRDKILTTIEQIKS